MRNPPKFLTLDGGQFNETPKDENEHREITVYEHPTLAYAQEDAQEWAESSMDSDKYAVYQLVGYAEAEVKTKFVKVGPK